MTHYGLGGLGIESRWGVIFSAPVHTGSEAHPVTCTMGTGSFSGVKRPERGVDHPPSPRAEVKERVELYLYSQFGSFVICSSVTFTITSCLISCSQHIWNLSNFFFSSNVFKCLRLELVCKSASYFTCLSLQVLLPCLNFAVCYNWRTQLAVCLCRCSLYSTRTPAAYGYLRFVG